MAEDKKEIAEIIKASVETYADLQSSDGHKYTVYNISVTDSSEHVHVLQKRFNEFNEIYRATKGSYPDVAAFKFPGKTLAFGKDQSIIKETRRERFNDFVILLMKIKPLPPVVRTWLQKEGHKGASAFRATAGQVTRAYKDRPVMNPAFDEKGLIYEMMMKPTPFLKFGRQGAPHWRNFALSADRKRIIWTSPNKKSGESRVLVSEIKYVENSQRSNVFGKQVAKKKEFSKLGSISLSIFYSPHGKATQMTLDIMCKHPDILRIWSLGIEMLVADYEQASPQDRRVTSAPAAAAGDGGDDDDDDAEEDSANLITGSCKAYTWGSGGWGQLGRAGDNNIVEEPEADADERVAAMVAPSSKKKTNKPVDVRQASCGGAQTVCITRSEGALVCGRAFVCCDAVAGSVRDHVTTGQFATGTGLGTAVPGLQTGLTMGLTLRQVACGESHTLFLTYGGVILASGSNFYGQLGDGSAIDHKSVKPVQTPWAAKAPRGCITVAAGFASSAAVALNSDGSTDLFTWGCNDFGVLGLGTTGGADITSPQKVNINAPPDAKITAIECGGWHMAALVEKNGSVCFASGASVVAADVALGKKAASTPTGEVTDRTQLFTWGSGVCGQLGHGSFTDINVPTSIGMLANGKEVVSVSLGAAHTSVVLDITSGGRRIKGQLWTWGNGMAATGQSDAAHSALPRYFNFTKKGNQNNVAVQVACGDNFTAVLDEDAAVTVIGVSPVTGSATRDLMLDIPKEDESKTSLDVESISAGGQHVCLIMAERSIV